MSERVVDLELEAPLDELVVRAKSDRDALGQLFDHYYPRIVRYCVRRLNHRQAGEDIASTTFVTVARELRSFRGISESDFRCWIYRIATNGCNELLRRTVRQQRILLDVALVKQVSNQDSTEHMLAELDWPTVYQTLTQLDEREQSIIHMRFFEQLSHEQIATILSIRTGHVRVLLSRTLDYLREQLDPANQFDSRKEPTIGKITRPLKGEEQQ